MKDFSDNEVKVLLLLFKDFSVDCNASVIGKRVGISRMGALKIVKGLEKQGLLSSKQFGNSVFYRINFRNSFAKSCLRFLLEKEAEQSVSRVKRWVVEFSKFKGTAEIGVLCGSILTRDDVKDVDLVLVLKKSQQSKVNSLLVEVNKLSAKKVHLVKQTMQDIKSNLKKKDKVLLSILKTGVVVFGQERLVEVVDSVSQ